MKLRVLIAVTHLLGVGHLTRAAAIARAFAGAGHPTMLVSGGVPAPLVSLRGVDLVQLPPVRITGTAFTRLLDEQGRPIEDEHLHNRQDLLLAALAGFRPHVVITELFPFGRRALAPEFLALFEAAHRQTPRPLVLFFGPRHPGRAEAWSCGRDAPPSAGLLRRRAGARRPEPDPTRPLLAACRRDFRSHPLHWLRR
jgi:hypothetical protein